MTAVTSAPGASPTPLESGQLRDTSSIAVPKSNRRKKRKSELSLSFDWTGSGSSPSSLQHAGKPSRTSRPPCLFTPFLWCCRKLIKKLQNDKLKPRQRHIEHSRQRQGKASTSKFSEFMSGEAIVGYKPVPMPLAELDAVIFGRGYETSCGRAGPSQKDDLLEALTTSQAQIIIINVYGMITGGLPGQASRILSCTFVYYKYTMQ
ncbi:hypothetical protein MTO96_000802 [Rhipicephalus appendiculatus]